MLLDEPFSALDTGLRAATRKAVEHLLAAAGIATILVTHDESEALSFADQIAIMREGRLAQVGSPDDIYWHPRDRGIAELLGEALILPAEISGGVARCILGAVPVAGATAPGLGTIMLRHEQVSLLPDATGGQGRIVEIEFGGFASTAVVALHGAACPAGTEQVMEFRCTNTTHLDVGNGVSFAITGAAHVLA
jgi:iron(III) transport system ATP-binding protein